MKIDTAYTDHLGGRDEQQDAVAVFQRSDGSECLVVLADGMGGHAGGSLASRTVVETAERIWRDTEPDAEPRALLAQVCQSAHEAINAAGERQNLSPRSTCVLLHLRDGAANWAHVGDSRLYRFRDGALLGRTRDHSVVQMLLDMGKITEEEMGTHPDQNRLTQSLGGDTDPEPDFGSDEARSGDSYLLCSDGLWEMVKPDEMAAALGETGLDEQPAAMAALAFERAGRHSDNISLALVRVDGPAVAAATTASEAPTRVAVPAAAAAAVPEAAPAAARRKSGGGRLVFAFLFVGVLAVGAAAAVVRPWEAEPYATTAPSDMERTPGERRKLRRIPDVQTDKKPDVKKDASRQPAPDATKPKAAAPNAERDTMRPPSDDAAPSTPSTPPATPAPKAERQPAAPAPAAPTPAPAKPDSTPSPGNATPKAATPKAATPATPAEPNKTNQTDETHKTAPPTDDAAKPDVLRPDPSAPKTRLHQPTDELKKAE